MKHKKKKTSKFTRKIHHLSDANSKRLSDRLMRLRERSGMTCAEVGKAMGVTGAHVYSMEQGIGDPSLEMLLRFQHAYKLKTLKPLVVGLK